MKLRRNPYGYRIQDTAPVQRLHPGELKASEPWPAPSPDAADLLVQVNDEADVVLVSQRGQALANEVGFSRTSAAALGTALSEVCSNIVRYAEQGTVRIWIHHEDDRSGLLVEAADRGPGIPDVDRALADGFTTGGSLGDGLGAARRLVDRFDLLSESGRGTTVRLLKWA